MTRLALAAAALLVASAASAKIFSNGLTLSRSVRSERPSAPVVAPLYAFRFLPMDAGVASECDDSATYAATQSDGGTVALSLTRAGTAYCTKGNGDMVLMASGKPRIANDATGFNPKLLMEPASTNYARESQTATQSGLVYVPPQANWTNSTITANAAAAPDGTTTADLLTSNDTAAAAGVWGEFPNDLPSAAHVYVYSAYVKSDETSETISVYTGCGVTASGRVCVNSNGTSCTVDTDAASGSVFNTTATSTWSRVYMSGTCDSATTGVYGGISPYNYPGPGGDVLIWGRQIEIGTTQPSSYIPTTTAVVARVADTSVSFTGTYPFGSTPSFSASYRPLAMTATPNTWLEILTAGESAAWELSNTSAGVAKIEYYDNTVDEIATQSGLTIGGAATRVAAWYDAANLTVKVGASQSSTAAVFVPETPAVTIRLKNVASSHRGPVYIGDVCGANRSDYCR